MAASSDGPLSAPFIFGSSLFSMAARQVFIPTLVRKCFASISQEAAVLHNSDSFMPIEVDFTHITHRYGNAPMLIDFWRIMQHSRL
jgi:hypothetical protein